MAVGGLGNYNPNWAGFTSTTGWYDVNETTSQGTKRKIIDGLLHGFYASGAYGAGWSNISANLPSNPNAGRMVLRVNTDASNAMRLYVYNGETSSWQYVEFT